MIIPIFFKKIFCLAVEPLIRSTWLISQFLAFWEIYIVISHWWPIIIPKTSNGVEWSWMMPFDVFSLKSMKKFWHYCKYHMKISQRYTKDIIPLQWWVIHPNPSNGSKIRAIQKLEIGRREFWSQQEISSIHPTDPQGLKNIAKLLGNM